MIGESLLAINRPPLRGLVSGEGTSAHVLPHPKLSQVRRAWPTVLKLDAKLDGVTAVARPGRVRYRVVGLMVALAMVTYLDRVCISKLAPDIMADLSLSK